MPPAIDRKHIQCSLFQFQVTRAGAWPSDLLIPVEMMIDLGVERVFGQRLLQRIQLSDLIQRCGSICASQKLIQ